MNEELLRSYAAYRTKTKDAVAAALLVVAEEMAEARRTSILHKTDHLTHEICMGLRHGLFGNGCTSNDMRNLAVELSDCRPAEIDRFLVEDGE